MVDEHGDVGRGDGDADTNLDDFSTGVVVLEGTEGTRVGVGG